MLLAMVIVIVSSLLSAARALPNLVLTAMLWVRCCYSHFTGEDGGAKMLAHCELQIGIDYNKC